MKLHSKETAELHKEIFENYKNRLASIQDDDEISSYERTFLHNAIYLHTLWFEQLENEKENTESPFLEEILQRRESDLGTFIKWMNDFAKDAKPHGWAVWGWSYAQKTFVGFPIKGHDMNVPLGVAPLIVIDCWEHSYIKDFGLDFDGYLDVFWRQLNYEKIEHRHKDLASLFGFNIK